MQSKHISLDKTKQSGKSGQKMINASYSNTFHQVKSNTSIISAVAHKISDVEVTLALGDLTHLHEVEVWCVPHTKDEASQGGVAGSILKRNWTSWHKQFLGKIWEQIDTKIKNYNIKYQDVFLTKMECDLGDGQGVQKWYGEERDVSKSKTLKYAKEYGTKAIMNLISAMAPMESAKDIEKMTEEVVYNALITANAAGYHSIALPAVNTGYMGKLTASESANAIYRAIQRFTNETKENRKLRDIVVVVNQAVSQKRIIENKKGTSERVYGEQAYMEFIRQLDKRYIDRTTEKHSVQHIACRRTVVDAIENLRGRETTQEERIEIMKGIITNAVESDTALDYEFIKRRIMDFVPEANEDRLKKVIEASATLHIRELNEKVAESEKTIAKQETAITEMAEVLEVKKTDPRFKDINEKINKVKDFNTDCKNMAGSLEKVLKQVQSDGLNLVVENLQRQVLDLTGIVGRSMQTDKAYDEKIDRLSKEVTRLKDDRQNLIQKNKDMEDTIRDLKSMQRSSGYTPMYSSKSSYGSGE